MVAFPTGIIGNSKLPTGSRHHNRRGNTAGLVLVRAGTSSFSLRFTHPSLQWPRPSAMAHFVDLHSHVLPGLDDGAKTMAESQQMLGLLNAVGFSEVCATPHQKAAQFLPSAEAIGSAF